jgi:hypothetical protein
MADQRELVGDQDDIRPLLKNSKFDLQEQQLLELLYRRILRRLNLVDRDDPSCEAAARKSKVSPSTSAMIP